MGAQKNRLIETVLLSTHNMCFGREIRNLIFDNAILSAVLIIYDFCHTQLLHTCMLKFTCDMCFYINFNGFA